jgi:CheY-like chemotaxis protein
VSATLRLSPVRHFLRIMIVEDDALIAMSLADIIHELGHEVIETPDPIHALAMIERGEPVDVLVTDVNMPRMDGRELACRVRQIRPGLAIVFATGYSAQKVPDVKDDPRARFVRKPFGPYEVAQVLDSLELNAADAAY